MRQQEQKKVIFHIDDIGSSESANRAAFALFGQGKATSGSIMVPCKAFKNILEYNLHGIDLGVHLTLTSEWDDPAQKRGPTLPISEVPTLVDKDGFFWKTLDEVYKNADPDHIYNELNNQIKIAREAGIQISHIDSHMGVLLHKNLFTLYAQLAIDNKIQPFICYPKQTDTPGHRFYDCSQDIQRLVDSGFKLLDAYESNSLYSGDNYKSHSQKRIEGCRSGTTYFLLHVIDYNVSKGEKTPDYKARQNEYKSFISGDMDEVIKAHNITKISFISV